MKKIISLILAATMVFCTMLPSFAAEANISATKTTVKKGETVNVTVSLSDKIESCLNFEYNVYFDPENFELENSAIGAASDLTNISAKKSDAKGSYYSVSFVDASSKGVEIESGTVYTLTFKAIKDVEADEKSSFEIVRKSVAVLSSGKIAKNTDGDIGTSKAEITVKCVARHIPGDINGDGTVNNKDVISLFNFLSGNQVDIVADACDTNGDKYIDNKDISHLFKYVSKISGIVLF